MSRPRIAGVARGTPRDIWTGELVGAEQDEPQETTTQFGAAEALPLGDDADNNNRGETSMAKHSIAELQVVANHMDMESRTGVGVTKTLSLEARTMAARAGVGLTAEEEAFVVRYGGSPHHAQRAKVADAIYRASLE